MARSASKILEAVKSQKILWDVVDESGNSMLEKPISAKTAADAALILIGHQKWVVRKVEDEPT